MSATQEQRDLVRKELAFADGMAAAGAKYADHANALEREAADALRAVLADSERLAVAEAALDRVHTVANEVVEGRLEPLRGARKISDFARAYFAQTDCPHDDVDPQIEMDRIPRWFCRDCGKQIEEER